MSKLLFKHSVYEEEEKVHSNEGGRELNLLLLVRG